MILNMRCLCPRSLIVRRAVTHFTIGIVKRDYGLNSSVKYVQLILVDFRTDILSPLVGCWVQKRLI